MEALLAHASTVLLKLVLPTVGAWLAAKLISLADKGWAKAEAFIDSHVESKEAKDVLELAEDLSRTAVRETAMATVDAAKKAAQDGKVPLEVAKAAKDAAIKSVSERLGEENLAVLADTVSGPVEAFIASLIEAAVHDMKVEKAMPSWVANAGGARIEPTTAAKSPGRK